MPVLPIATQNSLGGVKLDSDKDIQGDSGAISTKYNGLLHLENASVVAGKSAMGSDLCLAIGASARTAQDQAVALGYKSKSLALGSISVGASASVADTGGYSVALGCSATVTGERAVALGYGADASQADVVSVGSSTSMRRVVYVKDATGLNDAVNLGQLQKLLAAHGGAQQAQQVGALEERIAVLERQLALLMSAHVAQ